MMAVDWALAGFALALGALAVLVVPQPGSVLWGCGAIALCVLAASRLRGRLRVAHDFLPVPALAAFVNLCGPVIEGANPHRWDTALREADDRLFSSLVTSWTGALGRPDWLTDAASLAYFSYYLLPVAVAAALWLRRRDEFHKFAFAVTAVLLISYVAYFAAPAAGPRIPEPLAPLILGGGRFSGALRAFLRSAEQNQLDAFPSGHTAASLVVLAQVWPLFPRARWLVAAAVGAIVFSTVYLSLHYVVDVAAGAALALVVLAMLPSLFALAGLAPARPILRVSFRH